MRLKQIRLAGFKSFVDPTTVPLPGAMTAVVGPNGCGKSNIIDAVRWVLGESSAKNLRGESMTDVIFNGSSARKPVSQASVELVFDNSEGRLGGQWASFGEIAVRRLVNRDADNSYFLNGSRCRRKDITDLFLGTGLGPRSYAIIEQGMISRLIESRPQELRIFIEEAAGISKYKEKRRETETRLRHTGENLERLNDVRAELDQQLEKLKRQASAARRYRELKSRERQLKAELAVVRYLGLGEQMNALDRQISAQELAFAAADAELQRDETADLALLENYAGVEQEQRQLQTRLVAVATAVSRLEQQLLMAREQRRRRQQDRQQLAATLANAEQEIAQGDDQQLELSGQAEQLTLTSATAEQQVAELGERLEQTADDERDAQQQWRQCDQQQRELTRQREQASARLRHLQQQSLELQQRLAALVDDDREALQHELATSEEAVAMAEVVSSQCEQQLADQRQQADALQQQLEGQQQSLTVLREQLADANAQYQLLSQQLAAVVATPANSEQSPAVLWLTTIEVAAPWASVAEALLAPFMTAVIGDGSEQQPHIARHSHQPAQAGTLASVVAAAGGLTSWLNTIVLADDLLQARLRLANLPLTHSLLTADGHWLGHGWWVVVGPREATPLAWQQQLQQLAPQISHWQQQRQQFEDGLLQTQQLQLEARQQGMQLQQQARDQHQQLAFARQRLALAEQALAAASSAHERQQQQRAAEQQRLDELAPQLDAVDEQLMLLDDALAELQPQLLSAEQRQQQLHGQRQQLMGGLQQAQQQLQQASMRLASVQAHLQANHDSQRRARQQRDALALRLAQLDDELAVEVDAGEQDEELQLLLEERLQVEQALAEAGARLSAMSDERRVAQERRRQVGQRREQVRGELDRLRLEREGVSSRAALVLEQLQEMQVELKSLIETLNPDADEQAMVGELEQIATVVSRLGPINLAAIEEYDAQAERKSYLDAQYEDLRQAVETLENAIRRIDRETRQRFRDTFDQVNAGLQILFPKVFGGGSAYLALTDEDLLETGVTIMARPPGKKNSTIHLLSGGEKALTALSLVFAIFQLNPAPFCMLDEVDAPLDDANVGRFCNLVREMSVAVQFVFISHNKVSMEMATHLTGVTMHEPGVSRMVAVDIEQALSYAQSV
ncbi:MAG: chromosome segregation protein SMC [Gammaproteobacteria bacterium]|nr:chromosome segregation protein SMC [Gammaproteobacteria bacterium]